MWSPLIGCRQQHPGRRKAGLLGMRRVRGRQGADCLEGLRPGLRMSVPKSIVRIDIRGRAIANSAMEHGDGRNLDVWMDG
jgi:hypothetical protein